LTKRATLNQPRRSILYVDLCGGALAAPSTAYLSILPLGQQLWYKELLSYKVFPPLHAPETYNLTGDAGREEKRSPPERLTM